jgi:hypothetical protein
MDERRKERRKKLMAFAPVYDSRQGTILGYLADLTLQGAMVIGEHALEDDARLTLIIQFPGELEGISARRMTIPARVARCVPDSGPQSFRIGFEFPEMDPQNAELIQALLKRYHLPHQADTPE